MKEDFKTELLGIYPKDECLKKETELATTSLYPKGLNGNAGKHVSHTDEVNQKISDSKKGVKRTPFTDEHKRKMSKSMKRKTII